MANSITEGISPYRFHLSYFLPLVAYFADAIWLLSCFDNRVNFEIDAQRQHFPNRSQAALKQSCNDLRYHNSTLNMCNKQLSQLSISGHCVSAPFDRGSSMGQNIAIFSCLLLNLGILTTLFCNTYFLKLKFASKPRNRSLLRSISLVFGIVCMLGKYCYFLNSTSWSDNVSNIAASSVCSSKCSEALFNGHIPSSCDPSNYPTGRTFSVDLSPYVGALISISILTVGIGAAYQFFKPYLSQPIERDDPALPLMQMG